MATADVSLSDTMQSAAAEPVPTGPVVPQQEFVSYMRNAISAVLGAAHESALSTALDNAADIIQKFISDPQVAVLVVDRNYVREDVEAEEFSVVYTVRTEVSYRAERTASVVFIKKGLVVDADKLINDQLRFTLIDEGDPYESLLAHISKVLTPYFKSFVKESRRGDHDGDKLAPTVEKNLNEAEIALLHLQQNIEIPEIELAINPQIQAIINKATSEGRRAKADDLEGLPENSNFLNNLQAGVGRWIKEIQKVTKLDRDPASGTALQEATFWVNLERALHKISQKRESEEVTLTLEALKLGKRFHATISFDADTGLKEKMATVSDYNQLMKDLPLNELMSAVDIDGVRAALASVFSHLKKVKSTKYPVDKFQAFLSTISRDLHTQLIKILGPRRLMHVSPAEFKKVTDGCLEIFHDWDTENEKVTQIIRTLHKKRDASRRYMRYHLRHKDLETRLDEMRKFRIQHEQLSTVISRVLRPIGCRSGVTPLSDGSAEAMQQVDLAYQSVKEVDCLDTTREGAAAWEAAMRSYRDQISRIESQLAARLRDQLGGAKNADDMFAIFQRYNALFVRQHIRSAIREYQAKLIDRVKEDIMGLQGKYAEGINEVIASHVCYGMDVPPLSTKIMWIRQIEAQLNMNMRRVEDVLGEGWANHVDGRDLKKEGDSFHQKLNTDQLFKDWYTKEINKEISTSGRLYTIEKQQIQGRVVSKVKVNYSTDSIVISKEVRNLKAMGFRVPFKLVNVAHQANTTYPFAISLLESMRTYDTTNEIAANRSAIGLLATNYRKAVRDLVLEGAQFSWDNYKVESYVAKVAEATTAYQDKVEELVELLDKIELDLSALDTCQYNHGAMSSLIGAIQSAVDKLALGNYANLSTWVDELDKQVEAKLARRVESAIRAWTLVLEGRKDELDEERDSGQIPVIQKIPLEIRLTTQLMTVVPPVDQARGQLLDQLFAWHGIVTSQQRISATRHKLALRPQEEHTYKNVLQLMPYNQKILHDAITSIDAKIGKVTSYVGEWMRYQALWDLQPEVLHERLGNELDMWMKVLVEIKKSRAGVDTQETRMEIFPVIIDYAKVQSKVSLKYDYWHREVLQKFGAALGNEMQDFFQNISKQRADLEAQSLDSSSTGDAVALITYVQSLKKKLKQGQEMVDQLKTGQRLLQLQRYQFPNSWLYAEHVEGEWSALTDVLHRKDTAIQSQVANLQTRIKEEDEIVEKRMQEILGDWAKSRPVQGAHKPKEALQLLATFEDKFNKLKDDRENMVRAKNALDITDTVVLTEYMAKLDVAVEELNDLKGVWNALLPIYEAINEIKEKTWLSVQPRKVRQAIEDQLGNLQKLPSQYRSYESYEHARHVLQHYAKMNKLVFNLKSEALKDRHWRQLMREINVNWNLQELTLGQLWDADPLRHESIINQILLVAQGELALEEFMKQVRDHWQNYTLELANYQNKTRIIRAWDFFDKLREHMNSLAAMKLSPYYKEFEEDALAWEDRLNRINALFDVWIDVQRRWVYLEGLFSGSADIATLLPVESSRFNSISTEFLALMRKVTASPRILDVVHMQGSQRLLERLADMLSKIQKALGEYLERERSTFPRFYFVGDEDLLEIMGNSKEIARIQKHLKKMFAGIMAMDYNEETKIISAIVSREGEKVDLISLVDLNQTPRVNDWLQKLESEMRQTLAKLLTRALEHFGKFDLDNIDPAAYMEWLDAFPTQIVCLCADIWWSTAIENRLGQGKTVDDVLTAVDTTLALLSDSVLREQPPIRRRKIENLITEFVHKRDLSRNLVSNNVTSNTDFNWLQYMRFYFDPKQQDALKCCVVKMASAQFYYGFEYLGIQEKLVQTPLTDRCYLTMTQALHARLGGSPFGPAGTGKTESVKALGQQLGRFVLVFNCDETFDFQASYAGEPRVNSNFQAVGRILVGLCQVGAWGCFDEFNRLEERMLSAVSQQIQTIQESVRAGGDMKVDLVGKTLSVNSNMAIFITMNPGYSGRSNLPDNLKQLFRSLAMTQPDRNLIAEVMLFSQGFRTAEVLAKKIVPLFILCKEQLSNQCHYDFGLRALKYVLVSAGNIKREQLQRAREDGGDVVDTDISSQLPEQQILIQSVCETLVPKLVSEDITLLFSLLQDVFPNVEYAPKQMTSLRQEIAKVCDQLMLCHSDVSGEKGHLWLMKVLQLYQITNLNHGLMLVGSSGSGKTLAWKVLLKALERLEQVDGVAHVIDAKAMSKDALYGVLDANTREWTDGLFTHIIRKIIDNVRGEADKRQWIIFDGDVDPEWVENLNSVLDDNKLLTLPNGERLAIPPNASFFDSHDPLVRIIFEVADLKYATLATVSRCGMVWFSEEVVTTEMIFENYLARLRNLLLDSDSTNSIDELLNKASAPANDMSGSIASESTITTSMATSTNGPIRNETATRALEIQQHSAQVLSTHLAADGLVLNSLRYALKKVDHIMEATKQRLLSSFFSMMNYSVRQLLQYDENHRDFPIGIDQIEAYISRTMLVNLIWSLSGDGRWKCRKDLSDYVRGATTIALPPNDTLPIIDFEVTISGEWQPWVAKVPQMEIETHRVAAADIVVPTMDTVRHELLLNTWLSERKPLVLCGPPGSGKTMTLLSALRSQPDMDVINVNFSSSTTPELLMKTFDHYCEYRRTPNGIVLAPIQMSRWLVIFCDEINLPCPDKYGTQRVISFMRQLVELNGFYRPSDQAWISLERIQFVGACNPPTDPGRHPISQRFLRHVPIIYVDYPGETSLHQIYATFNRAMLRSLPALRNFADPLTHAMVRVYLKSQEKFTQDEQPHYVYSPRELTRWVRGISEAISPLESVSLEALVRLWAHEALRLFQDRLVKDDEREWTDQLVDSVAEEYFGSNCDLKKSLERPMLYSCWLTKNYMPVSRNELQDYVKARLKGFYEEELDVKLVLFDQMLDHVLRIDRIYRQPQGHLLLIGVSGSGKTTLSRFVAWMNGLSVFQLKVHSKYTAADFDEDIRQVLRRAGCRNEKICFIMDESNMLDTGFLERLNTLLANGEVPGLFEGDEFTTLMSQIKEGAQRQGLMLDSTDELYKWFTAEVIRNLHVVFTMNPSGDGLRERASTSPALFNRCVLNWFGDWTNSAFYQVGVELTSTMDMDRTDYVPPLAMQHVCELPPQIHYRHGVINTFVHVHNTVRRINELESKKGHRVTAVTPRHFLDFIQHYTNIFHEKRRDLEEEKLHLNIGLNKIRETEEQVKDLQKSLQQKGAELEQKKNAANAKLKEMLSDQQQAEKEKGLSEQLQKELAQQLEQIGTRNAEVKTQLDEVMPAVEDARQAVKGIKKAQLVEVRSMQSPPAPVKLAMESVCLLLGENTTDWKAIRAFMVRDDFIQKILQFDTESVTPETVKSMDKYVKNDDWDFEKVNRASTACGPMVKWCKSQLMYSRILNQVEPLQNEMKRLQRDADTKTKKGEELKETIADLEQRIVTYKDEYAQLIGQAENIKLDLSNVQRKVERSVQLLSSLRSERDRWQNGCEGFSQQMETLVGDALLSAAFLSYAGYYDQQLRDMLFHRWIEHLQAAEVRFRPDIARIEYLSAADDRLQWVNNGLPKDDLCAENAIMLHRFNRYPLIIDPSGQAVDYLLKQFASSNIQRTSFLDQSFRKNLESALRFGSTLLVQDVESYDPILNPVLNREVKRTGGRILITIGDQDIDLSPAFKIFLVTRDSSVEFPPDVCSRVTFVNFTVTRGSLEMQCLNQVLRSERPDIDQKRSDLLKLQGEFAVRLRQLEKALLTALNESKGKILDDDSVIGTLERLKTDAQEVAKKAAETDQVMKEVEKVSQTYMKLAHACSLIYLTLHHLDEIHFLYHYSLEFLLDIFTDVLKSSQLNGVADYGQRLTVIINNLFQVTYRRVSHGMMHADKVLLALLLMRIYLKCGTNEPTYEAQFDHLLLRSVLMMDSAKALQEKAANTQIPPLAQAQVVALFGLSRMPEFKDCVKKVESFADLTQWYHSDKPELNVPVIWNDDGNLTAVGKSLNELLVIHALRPDRLVASAHLLVNGAFGPEFMQQDKVLNLGEIIETEVPSKVPVLLCSATGFDASGKVQDLALETNREITSIAIGSSEGFSQADSALHSASKSGRWLLLKNVHLAPAWLTQLEKKLHGIKPHPQFRLLLTAEIHPKLPVSVIQASRVLVFEPATGLKANLLRSLSSIPPTRISKNPAERSRLYFLICWFHALVQERLRYRPLGWAHSYEFSDADLRVACDTLDAAVDSVALGRTNVSPDKLPWNALRTLLSQCIYGGKIDNKFDQILLDCFLQRLFTAKVFNSEFVLVNNIDGKSTPLRVPEDTSKDSLLSWVNSIKPAQLPNWIGLPNNAEKVLLTDRGQDLLKNMLKMSDDELAYDDSSEKEQKAPSWMVVLSDLCKRWLEALPKSIKKLKRTKENIKDPLFRFFEREINLGSTLLHDVRSDLDEILAVCRASQKQNNHVRALISALNKGQVPSTWSRYVVPASVTSMAWMADFGKRVQQLLRISECDNLRDQDVWLGGMFAPEAYVTATRQLVAQSNGWSLEQLHMHMSVGTARQPDAFTITGLTAIGAECKGSNRVNLIDEVQSEVDTVHFWWNREPGANESVPLPVYLYTNRSNLLFTFDFIPENFEKSLIYERGVAIACNSM